MDMNELIKKQNKYFQSQKTKDYYYRVDMLKKLKKAINQHEKDIVEALKQDLNKASTESYMSEIGMVLSELSYALSHLRQWMSKHRVMTPLAQFYAQSYTSHEPYGVVLIMSPWNYPFMLSMTPLIGAIASGNCIILKPSAYAKHTSQIIYEIISECFDQEYIACIQGGRQENSELLKQRFDYIFFTGGSEVGRLVMENATKHLTPITLELGGKSPCIVDHSANVKIAARRIAFGKYLNAGQTCVAPDYLFLHEDVKDAFIQHFKESLIEFFGEFPLQNDELPKIINEKHFKRLISLMEDEEIVIGGNFDETTLKIEPTLIDNIQYTSKIMQEEIFGPLLPIITYREIHDVIQYIDEHDHPLALYLFTQDKENELIVLGECRFGGGCVNDTIIHLASNRLPFGGVGASGMGSYHGKRSFTTFSHERSIVKKANWIDIPFRYHPYTSIKDKLIRLFLK